MRNGSSLSLTIKRPLNLQSRPCCGWSIARLYYYFYSVRYSRTKLLGRCHQDISKIGPGSDLWRVTSWKITRIRPSVRHDNHREIIKTSTSSSRSKTITEQVRQRLLFPACNFLATINFNLPIGLPLVLVLVLNRPRSHSHQP